MGARATNAQRARWPGRVTRSTRMAGTISTAGSTATRGKIVSCADMTDVQNAITWARAQGLPISVRSGGHSYEGAAPSLDNRLLIDLGGLERTWRGGGSRRPRERPAIGPWCASLLDLYRALAAEGHGRCG